jgi:hypothetical protein
MPAPGTVGHRSAAIGGSGLSETLRRGHEGAAVVQLQRLLAIAMPGAMKPRIDGHFGPSTEHALRCFQDDLHCAEPVRAQRRMRGL